MGLSIHPISLRDSNAFVEKHHRHHKPVVGAKFSIAVCREKSIVCGVAIVGRPVSRILDDGTTAEVTRVCTDGTRNACSMLYGAARRTARGMGYRRLVTYTLPEEGGTSLRASGFTLTGKAGGGEWSRPSRSRKASDQTAVKFRWEAKL